MADPIPLSGILTSDEVATLPFAPSTDLTSSMTREVTAHFAQCSPEDQRGFVLGAARIALAGRAALADALNTLVVVAIEYGEAGANFADDRPARRFAPEHTYGTPVAPTTFLPPTPPEPNRTFIRDGRRRDG